MTIARRQFIGGAVAVAGLAACRPADFCKLAAGPTTTVANPYGALRPPDANGLRLPPGFTSRVIARAGVPVSGTTQPWHAFPDGAGTFATADGGWILVSNSENPPPTDVPGIAAVGDGFGRVTAIRFSKAGTIVGAEEVLGSALKARSLCAGGPTPWGTWMTCEEYEEPSTPLTPLRSGRVFEVDPTGTNPPVLRSAMGHFKHEMAVCDPDEKRIYLSEDQPDGYFYRFTPARWGELASGTLEAARTSSAGKVTWVRIPDPLARTVPTRKQVAATRYPGGEGVAYANGIVYLATKGDSQIRAFHTCDQMIERLYLPPTTSPVLNGVDNLHIHPRSGALYVAEDGDDMQVVVITKARKLFAFLQATGPQHGAATGSPVPTASEITGITFNPAGDRLYFSSQRGFGTGITYEVRGPFY